MAGRDLASLAAFTSTSVVRHVALSGVAVVALSGCGSSWVDPGGAGGDCPNRQTYYYDGDADGWGVADGDGDGQVSLGDSKDLCEPDQGSNFTATNTRDCDDTVAQITGRVGGVCPAEMLPGVTPNTDFRTLVEVGNESTDELVAFAGDAVPLVDGRMAQSVCEQWGPTASPNFEVAEGFIPSGLQSPDTRQEFDDIAANIGALLGEAMSNGETRAHASWIGIRWYPDSPSYSDEDPTLSAIWDGTDWAAGHWGWVTPGFDEAAIGAAVEWCGAEPSLSDVFPDLDPRDPLEGQQIALQVPGVRLAMIVTVTKGNSVQTDACVGVPADATPVGYVPQEGAALLNRDEAAGDERYFWGNAHLACQRQAPDPEEYRVYGIVVTEATE